MSRRSSTRWYIGAWVVWVLALAVFFMAAHRVAPAFYTVGSSPVSAAAWLIVGITALVMLVTWAGALIQLAQLHAWGWFVSLLVLHLVGLGIAGMVAYAISGPEGEPVVIRPLVT